MTLEHKGKHKGAYSKSQKLEVMRIVCSEVASTSHAIKTICNADPDLPEARTIFKWLFDEIVDAANSCAEGEGHTSGTDKPLNQLYAQAKQCQMTAMGDQLLAISEDESRDVDEDGKRNMVAVNRDRLRVDSRKWLMSKLDRRNYGDKQVIDVNDTTGISRTQAMREAQKRAGIGKGEDKNAAHSPPQPANISPTSGKRLN